MENPWIPDWIKEGLTTKQLQFLLCDAREAFYGGAAGGGKSVALLAAALQFIMEPGYSSVIIRRTFKQLEATDSIMDKADKWLSGLKYKGQEAKWSAASHQWTFPNGNKLSFRHMDKPKALRDYQGGIWATICVDEASQFTEQMLSYPRTRQRRPAGSLLPMRWRGAGNPGDVGHEYLKARYVKDINGKPITDPNLRFFPATIEDNPHIDQEDYIRSLINSGVDELTLAQLLRGDWDAVAGGRFHRTSFRNWYWRGDYIVLLHPDGSYKEFKPSLCHRFLTVDPAASTSAASDFTVVSAWCESPWADLVWMGCDRFKASIPDIVPQIAVSARRYKPNIVGIESVYANSAVYQLAKCHRDPAMACVALTPQGKDKLVNATPAIVFADSGRLYLPMAVAEPLFPRGIVESELVRFTGKASTADIKDDIVDTLSQAVKMVTSSMGGDRSLVPRPSALA